MLTCPIIDVSMQRKNGMKEFLLHQEAGLRSDRTVSVCDLGQNWQFIMCWFPRALSVS